MDPLIVCQANVNRYYGCSPELLARYQEIAASGKCPFCAPHIENKPDCETHHWQVVFNQFPYPNSRLHFLVLPKRHIVSPSEINFREWSDMANVIDLAVARYPFLAEGCGLALRTGEVGGVSLYHLHWHLIVPKFGESGQIPVNFGIG